MDNLIKKDNLQVICRNERFNVRTAYYYQEQPPITKVIMESIDIRDYLGLANFSTTMYGFTTSCALGRVMEISASSLQKFMQDITDLNFKKIGSFHLVIGLCGQENTNKIDCHSILLTEDHAINVTNFQDFESVLLQETHHYVMRDCRVHDVERFLEMTIMQLKKSGIL